MAAERNEWTPEKANGNVTPYDGRTVVMRFKPPLPLSITEDDIVKHLSDIGFADDVTADMVHFVDEDTHVTFTDASVAPNVIRNVKGSLLQGDQGEYKVTSAHLLSSPQRSRGEGPSLTQPQRPKEVGPPSLTQPQRSKEVGPPLTHPQRPKEEGPPSLTHPAARLKYSQVVSGSSQKVGSRSGHPSAVFTPSRRTTSPLSVSQRHHPVPRPVASPHEPARPAVSRLEPGVPATAKRVSQNGHLTSEPLGREQEEELRPQDDSGQRSGTSQSDVSTTKNSQRAPQGGVASKAPTQPQGGVATKAPTQPQGGVASKAPTQPQGGVASKAPTQPQGGVASKAPTQPQGGVASKAPTQPQGGVASKPPTQPQGGVATSQPQTNQSVRSSQTNTGSQPQGGVVTQRSSQKAAGQPQGGVASKAPTQPQGSVASHGGHPPQAGRGTGHAPQDRGSGSQPGDSAPKTSGAPWAVGQGGVTGRHGAQVNNNNTTSTGHASNVEPDWDSPLTPNAPTEHQGRSAQPYGGGHQGVGQSSSSSSPLTRQATAGYPGQQGDGGGGGGGDGLHTILIQGLRPTVRDAELRREILTLNVVLDQCKLSLPKLDGTKEAILKVSQEADARCIEEELPKFHDLGDKIVVNILQ